MRLTDDDRQWGPITYGRTKWKPLRLVVSSGGDDDDGQTRNGLTGYAFGWVFRISLPNLIQPWRIKHQADWDAATIARLGRNWWYETHPREFGFCLCEGHLSIYYGAQTNDGRTTKQWGWFLPWTQWRHVRTSFYDHAGAHFWTEPKRGRRSGIELINEQMRSKELCPAWVFEFDDYDGQRITATATIEEREWRFGERWCSWLSIFRKPKIRRSLDLQFSSEVGPEKGSWKGGTIGHGLDLLPGELHEAAFRRYCDMEHKRKGRCYRLKFVRVVGPKIPSVGTASMTGFQPLEKSSEPSP